jgi:hypothetical protein
VSARSRRHSAHDRARRDPAFRSRSGRRRAQHRRSHRRTAGGPPTRRAAKSAFRKECGGGLAPGPRPATVARSKRRDRPPATVAPSRARPSPHGGGRGGARARLRGLGAANPALAALATPAARLGKAPGGGVPVCLRHPAAPGGRGAGQRTHHITLTRRYRDRPIGDAPRPERLPGAQGADVGRGRRVTRFSVRALC